MPLTGNVSTDIGEMLKKFKQTGHIGNTTPGSMAKARQIAAAAAFNKARHGKKKPDHGAGRHFRKASSND